MSAHVRSKLFLIKTPAQWDAVTSPVRLELVYALHTGGPLSIAEMAAQLDRPADSLYHHVRKLVAAGVFVEVAMRRVGKQTEAVYDFVADRLAFDIDPMTGRNMTQWKDLGQMIVRKTERAMCDAVDQAGLTIDGPDKDFWSRMDTAWLTAAELRLVNEHLYAVEKIFAASRQRRTRVEGGEGRQNGDGVMSGMDGESGTEGGSNAKGVDASKLFCLGLFLFPAVRTRHARMTRARRSEA